jgi:hypothetical protein
LPEVIAIAFNIFQVPDPGAVFGVKFWQLLKGVDASGNTFYGSNLAEDMGDNV